MRGLNAAGVLPSGSAGYRAKRPANRRLRPILALDGLDEAARRVLPRPIYGYIAGAAEDGKSLAANRSAFDAIRCRPKMLVDVSRRTQAVEIFGTMYRSRFGGAPVGISALAAYRGDVVLAQTVQARACDRLATGRDRSEHGDVGGDARRSAGRHTTRHPRASS